MVLQGASNLAADTHALRGLKVSVATFEVPLKIDPGDPIEVQTSFHSIQVNDNPESTAPSFKFYITSRRGDVWIQNAHGEVHLEHKTRISALARDYELERDQSNRRTFKDIQQSCSQAIDVRRFYRNLEDSGYNYGPAFQKLVDACTSPTNSYATLRQFDDQNSTDRNYIIHPTTLDALLHTALISVTEGGCRPINTSVPYQIKDLWVSAQPSYWRNEETKQQNLIEAISVASKDQHKLTGIRILAYGTEPAKSLIQIGELTMSTIEGKISGMSPERKLHCYSVQWQPEIDFLEDVQIQQLCNSNGKTLARAADRLDDLDLLVCILVRKAATELRDARQEDIEEYMKPHVQWLLRQNVEYNTKQHLFTLNQEAEDIERHGNVDDFLKRARQQGRVEDTMVRISENLPSMVEGQTHPLSLAFEDNLIASVYREGRQAQYFDAGRKYLSLMLHKTPSMTILEVGAGTGAFTEILLPTFATPLETGDGSENISYARYDYTDISSSYFEGAKAKFKDFPNFNLRVLDIAKDPEQQGFTFQSYDIIIAANVIIPRVSIFRG